MAQVGLGLAPLRTELHARPGETYSDAVTVSNESEHPTRVRASMLDFSIDENQEPQFRSELASEAATSCRSWVRSNPSEFELGPKQQKVVRFTVTYPAAIKTGSYHCGLAFTGLSPVGDSLNGVVTNIRLVTAIYAVMGESHPSGEVRKIEVFEKGKEGRQDREAAILLENTGAFYFRPVGKLEILNANGQSVETVPFRAVPVLPKRTQRLLVTLHSSYEPGQRIRARLDIGNGEIQEIFASAVNRGAAN
jgi:hypothetical protein